VRSETCLDPATVADADFGPLLPALADPVLCVTELRFSENGADWHFLIIRNLALPGPLWALPHDEEDAAFVTGVGAVRRYGGVMVVVENGEERMNAGLDPNRVFAVTAAAADVCPGTAAPAPLHVAAHLDQWDRAFPIIGLHTNWDGYLAAGGLGTISVRRQDEKMIPFPSPTAVGRMADEDTVVMLFSTRPPEQYEVGRSAVNWFNDRGAHVIYRYVTPENNECTLGDFLTLNAIAPYFNLEVEYGDATTQAALLEILMEFIASPNYRGML
jgi:hypothetical protein